MPKPIPLNNYQFNLSLRTLFKVPPHLIRIPESSDPCDFVEALEDMTEAMSPIPRHGNPLHVLPWRIPVVSDIMNANKKSMLVREFEEFHDYTMLAMDSVQSGKDALYAVWCYEADEDMSASLEKLFRDTVKQSKHFMFMMNKIAGMTVCATGLKGLATVDR